MRSSGGKLWLKIVTALASILFGGIIMLAWRPSLQASVLPRIAGPMARTQAHEEIPLIGLAPNEPARMKIQITENGLYRVNYADLLAAGFDPGAYDVRRLKLYNRGREVPMAIDGERDGHFDPNDSLLFYGTGLNDIYTNQNVYWLITTGAVGQRWLEQDGTLHDAPAMPPYFFTTVHFEEDNVYWQNMLGHNLDRWYWGRRLSPNTAGLETSRIYRVDLPNAAAEGIATVRVNLQGYTGLAHHTRIYFNDREIDEQGWWGQKPFIHIVAIPQAWINRDENIVRLETLASSAAVDQVLVNWIEVDYWHSYTAENNQLWFGSTITGPAHFAINDLVGNDTIILDITDVMAPVRVTNLTMIEQNGQAMVQFKIKTDPTRRYFLTTLAQAKTPATLLLDQPSAWRSPTNGADYIIITNTAFFRSASHLAAYRRATGLRVATVKVEDLYDEFNDGIFSPVAIRDFLRYAYRAWQAPAPTYVVLLGDANQDYKDNLQSGARNYVPSYNMDSSLFGEIPSDNWFVAFGGSDQRPAMFIGRLAAQSAVEAEDMVQKIIRYEQRPTHDSWNQTVLLVADHGTIFQRIAEQLATHVPAGYTVQKIYADDYGNGTATNTVAVDIINRVNQGSAFVTYVGHGHYASWGRNNDGFFFDTASVNALANGDKLPIVVVGNCLNGFFTGAPENSALAEVLQRHSNGGVIAVWAPSGLGYPKDHAGLLEAFYTAVFTDQLQTIGSATTAAKLAIFDKGQQQRELVDSYILFGDPALRLGGGPSVQARVAILSAK